MAWACCLAANKCSQPRIVISIPMCIWIEHERWATQRSGGEASVLDLNPLNRNSRQSISRRTCLNRSTALSLSLSPDSSLLVYANTLLVFTRYHQKPCKAIQGPPTWWYEFWGPILPEVAPSSLKLSLQHLQELFDVILVLPTATTAAAGCCCFVHRVLEREKREWARGAISHTRFYDT